MVKKKGNSTGTDVAIQSIHNLFQLVRTIVRTLGWPGFVFLYLIHLFESYLPVGEKQKFVTKIFSLNYSDHWIIFVVCLLSIITMSLQHIYYNKRVNLCVTEKERLQGLLTERQNGELENKKISRNKINGEK